MAVVWREAFELNHQRACIVVESGRERAFFDAQNIMLLIKTQGEKLALEIKAQEELVIHWRASVINCGCPAHFNRWQIEKARLSKLKDKLKTIVGDINRHKNLYYIVNKGYSLN